VAGDAGGERRSSATCPAGTSRDFSFRCSSSPDAQAQHRQFLLAAAKGEGVLFAKGSHMALKVEASPMEHRLVTSAPQELAAEAAASKAEGRAA